MLVHNNKIKHIYDVKSAAVWLKIRWFLLSLSFSFSLGASLSLWLFVFCFFFFYLSQTNARICILYIHRTYAHKHTIESRFVLFSFCFFSWPLVCHVSILYLRYSQTQQIELLFRRSTVKRLKFCFFSFLLSFVDALKPRFI